ncbi:hypothetical protein Hdeb2414_s0007g00254911 [Helianthus debilis subsp. tardiflorus]
MDYAFVHIKKDVYNNRRIVLSDKNCLSDQSCVEVKLEDLLFASLEITKLEDKPMEYYHGMLRCSWHNGFQHYVFTVDDDIKVFINSKYIKVESTTDEGMERVYTFHSKESDLLGEMSVSTSFEICPHGTQIMETKFVLCANGDNIQGYTHTLDQNQTKNIFKNHNVELAAIVMKDCLRASQKEVEIGGWGLKFLKKDRHCETCRQNTNMNVVVPAGVHGGPRSRNGGGPSSLVDRWRSGGSCDCGGWDLGCPLTALHARPNNQDGSFGDSVSFDLFLQGCKQSVPVLKMVEVRDGVYDLRYKSILSPLQSLSIVVAAIHRHNSSIMRPKLFQKYEHSM